MDPQSASICKRLFLVLPAHNPHAGWSEGVCRFYDSLVARFPQLDISLIICSDGSMRGYENPVISYLQRHIGERLTLLNRSVNRGKGFTVREGVREAFRQDPSSPILVTDWDIPFSYETYYEVVTLLLQGCEVVVPIRGESYAHKIPLKRKVYSASSHLFNRVLLSLPFTDTQGGLKGMYGEGIQCMLDTTIDSFLYDTEFVVHAHRRRVKMVTVAAVMSERLKVGNMKMKTLWKELRQAPVLLRQRWW